MRTPAAVGLLVGLIAGCGNGSGGADARPPAVCGNMITEPPEQCDDGNTDETDACRRCRSFQPHRTLIRWLFNPDDMRGFVGDGCVDVAAATVKVDLTGAGTASQTAACAQFQTTFDGLPAGDYTVALTPLDSAGASLVRTPVTATFTATAEPNMSEQHTVVVPPTAWSRPMTGTFLFLFKWGGHSCATATPPVARQRVLMTIGGVPVTATTMWNGQPGYKLDGTVAAPCVASTISLAERANALPMGPATVTVQGTDSGGTVRFGAAFDTFVGAGSNPVLTFDVGVPVDAGVDAPVDAAIDAP